MQKNQEGSVGSQFAGFNCSDLEVQMIPHTQTSTVCQPSSNSTDKPTCSRPSSSSFSTSECLRNISADLHYYHVILGSYKQHSPNISDLTPVMNHTKQLMQCLKRRYDPAEEAPPEGSIWTNSSFDNRKVLCKVLKGFVIRTVTINRVLGYISAGDHMK
ncbi:hypothetical protein DNTS_009792 [Danionella cerebrum]|uniref:Interleukin-12 subunit alpha n=1 Tax=Danionella cerebrum TaxID=2873325 RepID=A0A553QGK4_9TELE|nr:hypothetical protein DNTS_009792 [Danionella translucida]